MDTGDRLRQLRQLRGLTQRELAERSGMADSAIRKYESGRQTPKVATARRLAAALGVPVARLLGVEPEEPAGEARLASSGEAAWEPDRELAQSGVSRSAAQLARDYDRLDAPGRQRVRSAADGELERCAACPPSPPEALWPPPRRRSGAVERLEVYEQAAAAGLGNYLSDSPRHTEQYLPEDLPPGTDFGVVLLGDSMEPWLHSGGTVFVRAAPEIEPGQVGIFVLNGEAYCKRLAVDRGSRRVRLVSFNPAYPDMELGEADELRTLGRVLGQHTPGCPDGPFPF